jgi:hypothetical protein
MVGEGQIVLVLTHILRSELDQTAHEFEPFTSHQKELVDRYDETEEEL